MQHGMQHGMQQSASSDSYLPPPAGPVQPLHAATDNYASHAHPDLPPINRGPALHLDPQLGHNGVHHHSYHNRNGSHPVQPMMPPVSHSDHSYSVDSSYATRPGQAYAVNHPLSVPGMHPPPLATPPNGHPGYQPHSYPSPSSTDFRSPTHYSNLPSLPPFGHPASGFARSTSLVSPPTFSGAEQHPVPNSRANSIADFNAIDQMSTGYSMPVFGHDYGGFNRSPPLVLNEDWLQQLLGVPDTLTDMVQPSPPGPQPVYQPDMVNLALPKLEPDGPHVEPPKAPARAEPSSSSSLSRGLDVDMRESVISENKRRRLIELINRRFNDLDCPPDGPDGPSREQILENVDTDPSHVMSLHMLKVYLASFWLHIHRQMPILHRPTFNSETCPDLLLLAMMCLGASCLERGHPAENTKHCADMSFFLAYHIRWEVFRDPEFRPTAKLWTFQTMLLLELFEKMYSTKELHERAHIHHATTLIVMRRGSSLIGRSANEPPGGKNDPTRTPPGPDGTINTSGQNTPDATWNRWITAEATRRAAFAAFIIDSTHATLFGHSAVMSPHELKLPLPCDEALWAATSSAEVQTVEASLAANGFKPSSFIDGLKRTLNGQKVRTNTFGRLILMAGLLNVSWHMNQRDLQVSSLGAGSTLGNHFKWRAPLTRAFDHWRRDFDDSLSKNETWLQPFNPKATDRGSIDFRENVFESRTCLHSLAHMAMHVDMVDCTVFAGSDRVLGRVVTDQDRAAVQRRMRQQWAPSARARDAVFYALRFLCEVLVPQDELAATKRSSPSSSASSAPVAAAAFSYSARDDYLLNRPWVLYFAVLIVWSYGYALDGPLRPASGHSSLAFSREGQIADMQRYLLRLGGVASPDDLEKLADRNACLGLLLLLRTRFHEPRWQLLHEAGDMLGNCIDLLLSTGNGEVKSASL